MLFRFQHCFHLWLPEAKYAIAACGRLNLDGAMNVLVEPAFSPAPRPVPARTQAALKIDCPLQPSLPFLPSVAQTPSLC